MIITENIEKIVLIILGVFGAIALIGVILGNTALNQLVLVIVGILGGYLGNQLKGRVMAAQVDEEV